MGTSAGLTCARPSTVNVESNDNVLQGSVRGDSSSRHTGNLARTADDAAHRRDACRVGRGSLRRQSELHRQQRRRIEPQVDALEAGEALDDEAAVHEENHRHGDLDDDQGAEPAAARAATGSLLPPFQRSGEVAGARGLERRDHPENHACD